MSSRRLVNARLDNEVLTDKNEVDKDEAKSYMIAGLVTLALHFIILSI